MSVETITGTLIQHTYAQVRRGGPTISRLLADLIQPLPPTELWVINDSERMGPNGRPLFYRMRSGKKPTALTDVPTGGAVTVKANVEHWNNGIGGWITNVRVSGEANDGK